MARPKADTKQVTLRIPKDWLDEAELFAKVIGYDASPTDALRHAIRRGFDAMAEGAGPLRISAWDGVRTTCLFWVGDDMKIGVAKTKELAQRHAGGKWTVFRLYRHDKDEPIHLEPVKDSGPKHLRSR